MSTPAEGLKRLRSSVEDLEREVDALSKNGQPAAAEPARFTLSYQQRRAQAQLTGIRERLAALEERTGWDVSSHETADLERQVAELHRSLNSTHLVSRASRRQPHAVRGGAGSERELFAQESVPPSRRFTIGARHTGIRIARLPRRARRRVVRLLRGTKARIRQRLFARRLGSLNHHDPIEMKLSRRYTRQIEVTDPPTISIVTPSYNQGRFLDRTIRSVLEQDYPRLEYIVQDGGSTDESEQVLARHADRLHHHEMRDDEGQAHAVNLGFEHASGDVMAYLNSDDVLLPGSLHYVARYFEAHPDVDVVYGHRILIDEQDMEIGRWIMPKHNDDVLSWADFVPQETMFWRRRIWEKSGGAMDQNWFLVLDWDLLLRFRDANARIVRLPRFLGAFRIHEVQKTSSVMDTHGREEMAALRKRCIGREVTRPEISKAVRPYLRRHHVLQKLYRAKIVRY